MTNTAHGAGRTLPAGDNAADDGKVLVVVNPIGPEWVALGDLTGSGSRTVTKPNSANNLSYGEVALADTTSGAVDLTPPTPDGNASHLPITVKRQTGSNTLRILGTINGATNLTVTTAVTIYTDGTNWFTA